MNSSSYDRDPLLHRPYLWEHIGFDADLDSLCSQVVGDVQVSFDACQSSPSTRNTHALAAAYGRLLRMGASDDAAQKPAQASSAIMGKIAVLIAEMNSEDRQRVIGEFRPRVWLSDAEVLSKRLTSNDDESVTDQVVDLLKRLDDASLAMAVLQPSLSATDHAMDLVECLTWIEDHFEDFYEGMLWVVGVAETIRISDQADRVSLNATAEKYMLWTQQFSVDLGIRESVFDGFSNDKTSEPVAASDAAATPDLSNEPHTTLNINEFRAKTASAPMLSLAAGSESSEQVRERIESLPLANADVMTVDIGSDGVFSIHRTGHGFRCHFHVGVQSQPPTVTASSSDGETVTLDWRPLPSETSFQTAVFSAGEIEIKAAAKLVTVGLTENG